MLVRNVMPGMLFDREVIGGEFIMIIAVKKSKNFGGILPSSRITFMLSGTFKTFEAEWDDYREIPYKFVA